MIDLARAELNEIGRVIRQLAAQPATSIDYDTLLAMRFPGNCFADDLSAIERRQWLNELRGYQRGERIPGVLTLQPILPFTGGVSESYNQK
jgi:hypothetical protein